MAKRSSPAARQRMTAAAINPRSGLGGLLAEAGADKDTVQAARQIEATPGGPELLYTFAAEELMKGAGTSKKDAQKVRLYEMGGYVEKASGGLASAAQTTRKGGRGGDSMLVHMTPEEFNVIKNMWGDPDINPNTGLPEYGFLSKIWKKVKKAVKKVFKSKIFQIVAPIALSIFAPGLGTAIGSALGAGATAAPIVGNALIQGTLSAAGGGDFVKGALSGAITGGLGKVAGTQVQKLAPGISDRTAQVIGSSLAGGTAAEVTGGEFVQGAVAGGLGEYLRPTMEGITKKGQQAFGVRPTEGRIMAERIPPEELARIRAGAPPAPTYNEGLAPGEMGPPAPVDQMGPPAPPTPTTPSPAAAGGEEGLLGGLGKFAGPALAMTAMSGLGAGEYEEGQPPELPPGFGESLPVYASTRRFIGPTDPSAYYTYGQPGAPQTGEGLFITPDPFAGETGTPTSAGGLGQAAPPAGMPPGSAPPATGGSLAQMIAAGQVVPARMARYGGRAQLMAAGYTQDPQSGDYYPPQTLNSARGNYVRGPGTGRSDDIPARLSDGEYVIDAETVALLGDGSGDAGAKRLDEMRRNLRKHKAKNLKKGEFTHKAKTPERYMGMGGMPRLRAATAGRAR